MDEKRIVNIEEQLAFVQKELSDISDITRDLSLSVDRIEKELGRLSEKFHMHLTDEYEETDPDDLAPDSPAD
jgi:uncharacterized coiled-coil protein SlyX